MTSGPFFSVIIPAYNRARFIGDAIESVLSQKERDLEVIVVDDASTDGTDAVLSKFSTDPRVVVLRNPVNVERSASRNRGIAAAMGMYIAFLDSDDYFLENHLSDLREEIERRGRPVAAFYTGYRRVYLQSGREENVPAEERTDMLCSILEFHIPPVSVAIHREVFRDLRFDESVSLWEDVDLFARIALRYPWYHCAAVSSVWQTHGDNTEHTVRNAPAAALATLERMLSNREIASRVPADAVRRIRRTHYLGLMHHELANNRLRAALQAWCRLAAQKPDGKRLLSALLAVVYQAPGGRAIRRVVGLRHLRDRSRGAT